MRRFAALCLAAALVNATLVASPLTAFAARKTQDGAPPAAGQERPGGGRPDQSAEPRPYDRVITKDAKSDKGVFTVHRLRDRVFYEIPKSELGKEFLWVNQIARTTLGVGYGGQAMGNRVVKWERRGNRVLFKNVDYGMVADAKLPISRAVQSANNDSILMAFNIEAFGENESCVIDVTRLFTTDVIEMSAASRLRARNLDTTRSFIERVTSYPQNIEVEATHTYVAPPTAAGGGGGQGPGQGRQQTGMRPGSASVVMHFSMVKLPEQPMMPRLFDERVGYFSIRQQDFGQPEHRAPQRRYITRWRLDKKDPNAALSEPVKPIIYYVDPATPTWLVPYVKRGIEKWQSAFEEAGFKNAILSKEAPSAQEDPDWSPEDARYSVVRWLPSTTENAVGPHIHDPRTGEILESDIQMYHNVMNLSRNWYFTQAGPLDPRAQKLPLPDDLMGQLVEYVVAHEVGHTLGFQHNMKASSMYPAEKVRDREWVKKMGHTPTLMDYSRFNYVAQPEDNIAVADLIPGIGPYDKWATMWGYKPIPGATTPDAEKKTLDEWARAQDKSPWLRFSTAGSRGADPGELTEAVGDADAVLSTTLGLKNLERVSNMLLAATTKPGEPYSDLEEVYGRMLGQWATELAHVSAIVGGFHSQQKHGGQEGVRFVPIAKEKQMEAVRFLNERAFATPSWALKPEVLRRIEPDGALTRVRNAQMRVLNSLLSSARVARLVEQQAIDGKNAYAPTQFFEDVRRGVWSEVDGMTPVRIDAYRRNLQRAYIDLLDERLNGRTPVTDDQRPMIRGELRALSQVVSRAIARAADRETRYHLEDARDQIARALDPKFAAPAPAAGGVGFPFAFTEEEEDEVFDPSDPRAPLFCWHDYAVHREPENWRAPKRR